MFSLPEVQGKYPVGATTFAIPINAQDDASRVVGRAKLKASSGGQPDTPALKLEEVAFTAYYPADTQVVAHKGVHWFPRPVHKALNGYLHLYGLNSWLVSGLLGPLGGVAHMLKIPLYVNVPLLDPPSSEQDATKQWPLVIFSHGLGGTRTIYSRFCASLAAQGRIVLAIEHRDGTGPFVYTRTPIPGLKDELPPNCKMYLQPGDVTFDGEEIDEKDRFAFREDQLLFRRLELYSTYKFFDRLVSTPWNEEHTPLDWIHTVDGPWTHDLAHRPDDLVFWKSWHQTGPQPKVRCDRDVHLTGHSFGGATVLSVLSNPPPTLQARPFAPLPIARAVALDPWLEPLPGPGPAPHRVGRTLAAGAPHPPPALLVLNSEFFTLWRDHFARLQGVVRAWDAAAPDAKAEAAAAAGGRGAQHAWLVTLVRAKHVSFSDFGVVVPFGSYARDARRFLDVICELADAFLGGGFEEALGRQSRVEFEVESVEEKKGHAKRRIVGGVGDIVVH